MRGVLGVLRFGNGGIPERQHFEHEARIIRARQGREQVVTDIRETGISKAYPLPEGWKGRSSRFRGQSLCHAAQEGSENVNKLG